MNSPGETAVTLQIEENLANKLASMARSKGVSLDELLHELIQRADLPVQPQTHTPAERARLFREWASGHSITGSPLSDAAISRDSIYEDH